MYANIHIFMIIFTNISFLTCFQVFQHAIPSHTVYSTSMERIIGRLGHPTPEELEAEDIHRQEVVIKREIHALQSSIRI